MRFRLPLAALAASSAALTAFAAPAAAQATNRLIVVRESGEIVRIGAFTPRQHLGATRWPGVAPIRRNAIKAYGTPDRKDAGGCENRWVRIGVSVLSADFGGGDACAPSAGIQWIRIAGRNASAWRTDRGIRIGSSLRAVRAAYPQTRSFRSLYGRTGRPAGTYGLVFERVPGGRLDRLSAQIRGGRVVALEVSTYGAGD